VAPEHEERAWVVENVATLPKFRRRGIVDALLSDILEQGHKRGARTADIGVLIGNMPAQRAYEKNGFEIVNEKMHPAFEAAYGCPGIRSLSQRL
jgi:ribosomal protein S18 acetylase RimI-like enzyme